MTIDGWERMWRTADTPQKVRWILHLARERNAEIDCLCGLIRSTT